MPTENSTGQRERHIDRTSVANTNMVPPGSTVTLQPTLDLPTISQTTSAHITQQTAPTTPELHLMVCPLCGTLSDNTTFLKKSSKSSWLHGGRAPRNNIQHTSINGWSFVVRG